MSRYDAVEDPLCYPGTFVLRNKADIRDADQLEEFEQLMFDSRAEERLPDGELDFEHYRALHRHFFQDVYDWAGDIRSIRTGKGGNWFCFPEYIASESARIFGELARRHHLAGSDSKQDFAEGAAWFLSEINAVHPFREGNGRIQLTFLTMLARNGGFKINERKLRPDAFLEAMIKSFSAGTQDLAAEVKRLL